MDGNLTPHDVNVLLRELARRLQQSDVAAGIRVVGGAAIALMNDQRRTTRDIDAALHPADVVKDIAAGNERAIVVETGQGLFTTVTFSGLKFSGNTADVRSEASTNLVVNLVGGSNASTSDAASGTITYVNSTTLTLTGLETGCPSIALSVRFGKGNGRGKPHGFCTEGPFSAVKPGGRGRSNQLLARLTAPWTYALGERCEGRGVDLSISVEQ